MNDDLTFLSITEAGERFARGALSPLELVEACIARMDRAEPLGAVWTLTGVAAHEQGEAATNEIAASGPRHPLHGIPIAHKDLYDTAGVRTTGGASFLLERVPEHDAVTVAKLREAGAISLGKLAMHELAAGVDSQNPHLGPCANPWDPDRIPGGSSGGSGTAVAAGLCFAATGSDTGGSIRIPAALCGCVGIKGTYGLCSRRGVLPLSWSLDHTGPLARSVEDAALVLETMAGHDPLDPASANRPVPPLREAAQGASVEGMRIALARDYSLGGCAPTVRAGVEDAARRLQALGATIVEIDLPSMDAAFTAHLAILVSEFATVFGDRLESLGEAAFGSDVATLLAAGLDAPARGYLAGQRIRQRFARDVARAMADVDCLLTPATAIPAPLAGEHTSAVEGGTTDTTLALIRYTIPFDMTGQPCVVLPVGLADGLPIAAQLVAHPFQDATAIRAAAALEADLALELRPPHPR